MVRRSFAFGCVLMLACNVATQDAPRDAPPPTQRTVSAVQPVHPTPTVLQAEAEPDTEETGASGSSSLWAIAAKPNISAADVALIRKLGPDALHGLSILYESSSESKKAQIARIFYQVGVESRDAKRVLMQDVHTSNSELRIEVQWALGRVSKDDDVVDVLVDNMKNDANPLFREKSACALASDQIHLDAAQHARMLRKVIEALSSDNVQVRSISRRVLQEQSGLADAQGFDPSGPIAERSASVARWEKWLLEREAER